LFEKIEDSSNSYFNYLRSNSALLNDVKGAYDRIMKVMKGYKTDFGESLDANKVPYVYFFTGKRIDGDFKDKED
jgi:hypothetical protein